MLLDVMGKAVLISGSDNSRDLFGLIKEKAEEYSPQLNCLSNCTLFVGPCPDYKISPEEFFNIFNVKLDAVIYHYCCYSQCTFDDKKAAYVKETLPKVFENILKSTVSNTNPWIRYSFDLSDRIDWDTLMRFPGEGFISGSL